MSNNVKRITAFAAALMLCLTPAAGFAENAAGSTASAVPESSVHTDQGHRPYLPGKEKGFRAGGGHFVIHESSRLLEMDRNELIRSLKGGKSLYTLAKEKKGWTEEQYIQKLSDAASVKLEASLKDGQLTRDEAAKLKAGLPALLKLSISRMTHFQESKVPGAPARTP